MPILIRRFPKINSLPGFTDQLFPEILERIFLNVLPDHDSSSSDPNSAPLLLCHICRKWREIAISTPRLWNQICIGMRVGIDGPEERPDLDMLMLRTFIERSGNRPLFLSIKYEYPPTTSNEEIDVRKLQTYRYAIERLINYARVNTGSRWRSCVVVWTSKNSLQLIQSHMPQLEDLSITLSKMIDPENPPPDDYLVPMLSSKPWLPRLKHLTINTVALSVSHVFQIFHHAPLLEDCYINVSREGRLLDFGPDLLVMPHLTNLCLEVSEDDIGLRYLLMKISLPKLHALRISVGQHGDADAERHFPYILDLLTRSKSVHLTSLALIGFAMDVLEIELLECFKNCPNLTSLRVSGTFTDYIMTALTQDPHEIIEDAITSALDMVPRAYLGLCPKLVYLYLSTVDHFTVGPISLMVASRNKSRSKANKLRSLGLDSPGLERSNLLSDPVIYESYQAGMRL